MEKIITKIIKSDKEEHKLYYESTQKYFKSIEFSPIQRTISYEEEISYSNSPSPTIRSDTSSPGPVFSFEEFNK